MNRDFSALTSATASIYPISVTLLLLALLIQPTWAEVKQVKATREQVAQACEAAGGTGYGYEASHGDYGCITDIASIDCDESGNCEGEVFDDEDTTKSANFGQQAHAYRKPVRRTNPLKLPANKRVPTTVVRDRTKPNLRARTTMGK